MTTALLAARMLAPGEDPGLVHYDSAAVNLLLVLLWLLAAVALAVWRVWSRRGDWRGGLVETALLVAVVVLAFVASETAYYKHPARLIAWDWLVLFLAVCLVRQLAVSAADQRALFGVFLAGAAALSFQAVYQSTVLGVPASATFTRPDTFAAWLALFLPGLIAAVIVCRPGRAPRWQTVFTAVFALLGAAAFGGRVFRFPSAGCKLSAPAGCLAGDAGPDPRSAVAGRRRRELLPRFPALIRAERRHPSRGPAQLPAGDHRDRRRPHVAGGADGPRGVLRPGGAVAVPLRGGRRGRRRRFRSGRTHRLGVLHRRHVRPRSGFRPAHDQRRTHPGGHRQRGWFGLAPAALSG